MSFQVYWVSRGKEKHLRIDASSLMDAEDIFLTRHPRLTIIRIIDVTPLVRNGLSCW